MSLEHVHTVCARYVLLEFLLREKIDPAQLAQVLIRIRVQFHVSLQVCELLERLLAVFTTKWLLVIFDFSLVNLIIFRIDDQTFIFNFTILTNECLFQNLRSFIRHSINNTGTFLFNVNNITIFTLLTIFPIIDFSSITFDRNFNNIFCVVIFRLIRISGIRQNNSQISSMFKYYSRLRCDLDVT